MSKIAIYNLFLNNQKRLLKLIQLNETHPDGTFIAYTYDTQSHLTQAQYPQHVQLKLIWNAQDQLLARQVGKTVTRYSYNALGFCNGIYTAAGLRAHYTRNKNGQLMKLVLYCRISLF